MVFKVSTVIGSIKQKVPFIYTFLSKYINADNTLIVLGV